MKCSDHKALFLKDAVCTVEGTIDHQSQLERWKRFERRDEDDEFRRRVSEGRLSLRGQRGENQNRVCKCFIQRSRLLQACGFISFCSYWQEVPGANQVFLFHVPSLVIWGAWCIHTAMLKNKGAASVCCMLSAGESHVCDVCECRKAC